MQAEEERVFYSQNFILAYLILLLLGILYIHRERKTGRGRNFRNTDAHQAIRAASNLGESLHLKHKLVLSSHSQSDDDPKEIVKQKHPCVSLGDGLPARGKVKQVLSIDKTCPIIVTARPQTAGLAHSFMSFLSTIALASYINGTSNVAFPVSLDHGVDISELHSMFSGQLFNPKYPPGLCTSSIHIDDCSGIMDATISARSLCEKGPVCIYINQHIRPAELLVDITLIRSQFTIPDRLKIETSKVGVYDPRYITIAVHLRRGDIVNNLSRQSRWTYNKAYMPLISEVVKRIKSNLPIMIVVYAEGADSSDKIPDVQGHRYDNFSGLADRVEVGPEQAHLALAGMCQSDILITSMSGFSHLASMLCPKPRILATPFWHSYSGIPNLLCILEAGENSNGSITTLNLPSNCAFSDDTFI
jgi:hypothetical protein